ncbi:mitochondrial intermediate peptidase-like [Acanthaster planci]|uniref:Mitochondrial intermediate peptidase n=1 Tax=Acanthaster planci TaxID=133434 RepID=A0A8B7ZR67_ACAPL|nr:mitochondrial intermediate peptidase-like [Acanthaster planci]
MSAARLGHLARFTNSLLRPTQYIVGSRPDPCHKYQRVTTWSPLASAFNARPKRQLETSGQNVGLFGMPELTSPGGFAEAQRVSVQEAEELVQEAIRSPTSAHIVVLFDKLSDALCRVADLADFVRVAHPDQRFARAAEDACVHISAMVEQLNTNVDLKESLQRLLDDTATFSAMDEESQIVARLFMFDFEQSGIHLEQAKRQEFVRLNEVIHILGSQFVQGTQTANAIEKRRLPQHIQHSFAVDGENVAIGSLYGDNPSDLVREAAYKIFLFPNPTQSQLLDRLLDSRHRLASLVGFSSYAQRALRGTMAQTPDNVMQFLTSTGDRLFDRVSKEIELMKEMKKECNPFNPDIFAWDPSYYIGAVRNKRYHITNSEYAPYFSVGACMDGLSLIFSKLYGVTLENVEAERGELWAPDVLKLAVTHETEGVMGYIYCDLFERPGKPQQDCHFTIRGGRRLDDGSYQLPKVVLVCSFSPPRQGAPSLLSHGMMENLFHEFGHAMHSMLARTRYQHVTGTRCATDFAEVPSILMEYFANDYRVLKEFARHHKTDQTLPEEMIARLCTSKKQFAAFDMQTQVFYSILDQVLHGEHPLRKTTVEILSEVQNQYSSIKHVPGTAWHLRFGHLVGYGAKYYSYLLSRAVASSIWHKCFAADPLSRDTGERYRWDMLAHGGGREPTLLVQNMIGKKLSNEDLVRALLEETEEH